MHFGSPKGEASRVGPAGAAKDAGDARSAEANAAEANAAGSAQDAQQVAEGIARLVTWARRCGTVELSSTAVTTLDTLHADGPLRLSELARRERVSQPGMTALVNRLTAAGHAERVADTSDGRATLVRITEDGRKVLADRQARRIDALQDVIADLPDADRQALVAAIPAIERLIGPRPSDRELPRDRELEDS